MIINSSISSNHTDGSYLQTSNKLFFKLGISIPTYSSSIDSMASLPSTLVGNTVKIDRQFKRLNPSSPPPQLGNRNFNTKELDPSNTDFREALRLIQEGNTKVESSFYVPLLQECIERNSVSDVDALHAHVIKRGSYQNLFLMTFLVNAYGKCGTIESAQKVFDNLPERNVVTWTSLMAGYVQNSQPQLAISVFKEMLEVEMYPTNYTLGVLLNACSSLCDIRLGMHIHGYIIKYGIECDASIGNALCIFYSKCGSLDMAINAFCRIREKDVISWTSVITACGDNGDSAMGLDMFVEMLSESVKPNEFTLTSVLSLCCVIHALGLGTQVHSLSIKLGCTSRLPVTNSIMYLYLKTGCIDEAKKLFDGMNNISLITWNAMIAGHAQIMDLEQDGVTNHLSGIEALKIFQKMRRSGTVPDLYTFSSILSVCSNLVALEQGEQVHAQTIKSGWLSDVVVGTALVNMYNKCGSISRASKAFVEMSRRTLISWTSMITAFAQHGLSQQASQLFDDMRFVGVRPNKITFVGVLSACSQAGMVEEALAYFELMKNEYKISPVMDHYGCLIDVFVRVGRIEEAFDFIKKMDFKPSEFIWSVLIAGCRSHGKLELAYYAAEQLLDLKPKDPETYVLLLNLYLSGSRWKDVSRVRKMMKDKTIGKLKDWSWISIRNNVYSFKAEKQVEGEVMKLLKDLQDRARNLGYQKSEVGDDEEKEETNHHSEKLAVAFGLANANASGGEIRVIKSISMCRDCHNFIKIVSIFTPTTIIVRDSKRLHIFSNGNCSCGDFGSLL